jgi:hypothetical protein
MDSLRMELFLCLHGQNLTRNCFDAYGLFAQMMYILRKPATFAQANGWSQETKNSPSLKHGISFFFHRLELIA